MAGRRPGRALLVGGVTLLVLAGSHLALGTYRPELTAGPVRADTPGKQQVLPLAEGPVTQIDYLDLQTVQLRMPVRNDGRLPLTLIGVERPGPSPLRLMRPVGLERPVTLWPGQERTVTIQLRFSDCEFIGSRSSSLLSEATLRYRVLWRSGTVTMPLRPPLRATSPRDSQCPRSTVQTRPPG